MKKFAFTLKTVHKVREMREDKEKLIYGEMQAAVNQAAGDVENIQRPRINAMENYAQRMKSGGLLDPMEMALHSNHFEALNRRQQEAEKVLAQKQQECEAQGKTLAAAMREVKITDRLRETQKSRYDHEFAREEQNNIDELISASFARQILR